VRRIVVDNAVFPLQMTKTEYQLNTPHVQREKLNTV